MCKFKPRKMNLIRKSHAAQITQITRYEYADGTASFPMCPNCKNAVAREYQSYCSRCGQKLGWDLYDKID